MECLFCKIAQGEMNTDILYKDEQIIAFRDIAPQAPSHILLIPRHHISTLNDLAGDDTKLMGHMTVIAQRIAQQIGIAESGYRLVMNCNQNGGQSVFHIHMHLLGGRQMCWPPG